MAFRCRDWLCECGVRQEFITEGDEIPACPQCKKSMSQTFGVINRGHIDVHKRADFKRAEKKGYRVREMVARQEKSFDGAAAQSRLQRKYK